jgi:hypothetical protein
MSRGTTDIPASARAITADELAFYEAHGWVKLDGFIASSAVTELRRAAEEHLRPRTASDTVNVALEGLARDGVEPFRSLVFSDTMAQNARRLANRRRLTDSDIALRYRADVLGRRPPGGQGTRYHQDSCEHGSDRVGEMQFWLALDEVTPSMGAMRFLSGSHREGPLGTVFAGDGDDRKDLLQQYPKLADLCPLSEELFYMPGDATVHHGYTGHGAPGNRSDRVRWNYLFSYVPADTRWWRGTTENAGSERVHLTDAANPVVSA